LIDGGMACPPEDIGGTLGFEALKEAAVGQSNEHGEMILESLDGEFDPEAIDEDEIAFMLMPIQSGFRRGGGAQNRYIVPPKTVSDIDMERSLKAQGIHSIEELEAMLQKVCNEAGIIMVNRNAGSGTRLLLDRLLGDARRDMNGETANIWAVKFYLSGMNPGADINPEGSRSLNYRQRAMNSTRRAIEGGEETVAEALDLVAAKAVQGLANDLVMRSKHRVPTLVAKRLSPFCGGNYVSEQDRRQHAVD
jgi:hypothetical protein